VVTPSGQRLLFETYLPYDRVSARTGQLLRSFGAISVISLLGFTLLLVPILWRLLDGVRAAQDERVALLQRAVDASSDERRRIAGTLHDGVVQELAAASFSVSGASERASSRGDAELAGILHGAALTVRGAIAGLRSLLVDIYPPSLRAAGLPAALGDLAGGIRARDIDIRFDLPPEGSIGLDAEGERLVYRVAQEALRNVARHSGATSAQVTLTTSDADVTLVVADGGAGFDVASVLLDPPEGHFGLRVMTDLATESGARLEVCSAPGEGTQWRLSMARS
jgi:two-component system NarL family sensor kinase